MAFPRIASLKTADAFRARLAALGLSSASNHRFPRAALRHSASGSIRGHGRQCAAGNRWCILPMEGWDGTIDGHPSDLTSRRWTHFGQSGAKIIWGGEAVAVAPRRPRQPEPARHQRADTLAISRRCEHTPHRRRIASDSAATDDLAHRPAAHALGPLRAADRSRARRRASRIATRCSTRASASPTIGRCSPTRSSIALVDDFVAAAAGARATAGFAFVDIKHCHGYLGHELLSARSSARQVRRQPREPHAVPRRASRPASAPTAPASGMGVRLSAFDMVPFRRARTTSASPSRVDEPLRLGVRVHRAPARPAPSTTPTRCWHALPALGIHWVCVTAGSPYYNPHIQRPAIFPPSDGYLPPEDPLVGVARQIDGDRRAEGAASRAGARRLRLQLPAGMAAARRAARDAHGLADVVGLGRMVLSYPELPADMLAGRPLKTKLLCRTFSDCTTAPRNGLVSGCYPLDPFYVKHAARRAAEADQEGDEGGDQRVTRTAPGARRRHRLPRALLHRRHRAVRAAVLLRLLRPRARLDARRRSRRATPSASCSSGRCSASPPAGSSIGSVRAG